MKRRLVRIIKIKKRIGPYGPTYKKPLLTLQYKSRDSQPMRPLCGRGFCEKYRYMRICMNKIAIANNQGGNYSISASPKISHHYVKIP